LCLVLSVSGCGDRGDQEVLTAIRNAEDARGRGPEGLAPIQQGISSPIPSVQIAAVRALGRLEDPDQIDRIATLLASPESEVRAEAVNALGQAVFGSKGEPVADLLLEHLSREGNPDVRGVVGRTLGRIAYDDPARVREAGRALIALTREAGGDAPLPSLLGAVMGLESLARMNREVAASEEIVARLGELGSYGRTTDDEEAARVRRVVTMALISVGLAGDDPLRSALEDTDPDVRRLAVSALVRDGSFAGGLAALREALTDPVPRVRAQAVVSFANLAPMGDRCEGLLEAASDETSQVAIAALDLLGEPCSEVGPQVQRLREFAGDGDAQTETGWHRGAHALVALARLDPSVASTLVGEYAGHPSPFARAYAARAAGITADRRILESLAGDRDPNVRTAATQALFRLVGHDADPLLVQQLTRDDPQLLLTVAGLLEGTLAPAAAVRPLLETFHRISAAGQETLRDPRMGILQRLDELGGTEISAELEPYLSDYDPMVAERVADLVTEWTGQPTVASPSLVMPKPVPAPEALEELAGSRVILEMEGDGEIAIRLFPHEAPTNALRFAELARSGALDGLTFHRVVSNFVIQGGSPNANEMAGHGHYTRDEIGLLSNWRGTVGTSTRGRNTGDGQIFINLVDNLRLDHNYTIFGEVVTGMDVVDRVVEGQKILRASVGEG
jgi:cyclophilin family peptidyl-prolyl cis-trans isomerase/HEAT repeat protein